MSGFGADLNKMIAFRTLSAFRHLLRVEVSFPLAVFFRLVSS